MFFAIGHSKNIISLPNVQKNTTNISQNLDNQSILNGTQPTDFDLTELRIHSFVRTWFYFYGMFLILSFGIISNIILFCTLISSRRFRQNSAGLLMLTLSCVDCLANIGQMGYHIEIYYGKLFKPWCFVTHYVERILICLSHLIVLLISVNRYALVCHPFTHIMVTSRKRTIIQLIAVILICSTFNIYLIFSYDPKLAFCGLEVTYNIGMVVYYVGVTTLYIVISNLIPIIVTLTLTLKVMYTLAKNSEAVGEEIAATESHKKGERQLTNSLVAVNIAFIVLSLPYLIVYTIYLLDDWVIELPLKIELNVEAATGILQLFDTLNYSINLFLYAWYSPLFRAAVVDVLMCRTCRSNDLNKQQSDFSRISTLKIPDAKTKFKDRVNTCTETSYL